jgi:hypothetical protein
MRTKITPPTPPPPMGYQIVEKKVRELNEFLKTIDVDKLLQTIEKDRIKNDTSKP